MLADTFVTERRHKDPKRFAMSRLSGISYEKGLMEDLVLQHLHDWRHYQHSSLTNPQPLPRRLQLPVEEVFPGARAVHTSSEYIAESGGKFRRGDTVLLDNVHNRSMGKIWYHFDVDGTSWSCLSLWPLLEVVNERYARFRVTEDPTVLPSTCLTSLCVYRLQGDVAIAIWPQSYRLALARMA